MNVVDKKHQSRNIHTSLLPTDFTASAHELNSIPEPDNMQTMSTPSETKTNIIRSPIGQDTRRSLSKIPIRMNSPSQSRSRSPTINRLGNLFIKKYFLFNIF